MKLVAKFSKRHTFCFRCSSYLQPLLCDCLFWATFVWNLWILPGHLLRIRAHCWDLLHCTVACQWCTYGLDHRLVVVRSEAICLYCWEIVLQFCRCYRTRSQVFYWRPATNSWPIAGMCYGLGWFGLLDWLFHCWRYVWHCLLFRYMLTIMSWSYNCFYVLQLLIACFVYFLYNSCNKN